MNKSGILNRSSGGPEDDLALSLDETDFAISESNFSHSMMSNKIGQFANASGSAVLNTQQNPKLPAQNRERAST